MLVPVEVTLSPSLGKTLENVSVQLTEVSAQMGDTSSRAMSNASHGLGSQTRRRTRAVV